MCAERMQRILTGIVLGIIMGLFANGITDPFSFKLAVVFQAFVMIMLFVWAITNFCPSLWLFKKIFPPCPWECRDEDEAK